jgi:hypothetical protein
MVTKKGDAWSVMNKDGNLLARGLARQAASAYVSWGTAHRESGADGDNRRELRGDSDAQSGDGAPAQASGLDPLPGPSSQMGL